MVLSAAEKQKKPWRTAVHRTAFAGVRDHSGTIPHGSTRAFTQFYGFVKPFYSAGWYSDTFGRILHRPILLCARNNTGTYPIPDIISHGIGICQERNALKHGGSDSFIY